MRRIAALSLAAALAACTTPSGSESSGAPAPTAAGGSAPSPLPEPRVRSTTIDVGGTPWGIAYGYEAVWAPVGDEVVEINVRTDDIESTVPLDRSVTGGRTTPGDPNAYDSAAIGVTGVWVTVPRRRLTVVHVDPKYQRVLAVIPIGDGPGRPVPIAVEADAVWVPSAADGRLVRIDPRTERVVDRFPLPKGVAPAGIALAGGSVWISDAASDELLRFDPSAGRVVDRLPLRGSGQLATDGVRVWAVSEGGGAILSVNASRGTLGEPVPVCDAGRDVALGTGLVWVSGADALCVADPAAGSATAPIPIDGAGPVTAYDRSAWVAVPSAGSVVRVDAA